MPPCLPAVFAELIYGIVLEHEIHSQRRWTLLRMESAVAVIEL